MKKIFWPLGICLFSGHAIAQQKTKTDTTLLQPIEITSIRAADNTPVAKVTLGKLEIDKKNIGYDLPFILNQTPSVQVNADAGNGIGYTGIRIRGTDATRINLSLNSIPYNDAESQGTFLVNLPDFASSANSIQIQRGVGTSTNGAGSFGGSININTNDVEPKKYIECNNAFGSYHSFKNTLILNSGLLKKHFLFKGRISNIQSDGYIDRSNSKLQSFFTSAAYIDPRHSVRLNIFSGKEKTHAAWFGINQATLDTNRTYNPAGTEKMGSPYPNETDNYNQTHYQLFLNQQFQKHWKASLAFFITTGKGYFEQYKADQSLSNYGLPPYINGADTSNSTDLVRQLWLDNIFYGTVFSTQYKKENTQVIIGGSINRYDGNHFGKIITSITPNAIPNNYEWYRLKAKKMERSLYSKWIQKVNNHIETYVDIQFRNIPYQIKGFQNNPNIIIDKNYFFFNPKLGLSYLHKNSRVYFSYANANKEPNRDDFETSPNDAPSPEQLHDVEWGYENKNNSYKWGVNCYYMLYKNQLVLTGKVNQVFAYTRTNIPNSFRQGIELFAESQVAKKISISGSLTLSRNKIKDFTEYVDDYDNNTQQTILHTNSDISFSPRIIGNMTFSYSPIKNMELQLLSKYIGKQYLDNTSNENRKIKDYFVQDLKISWNKEFENKKTIGIFFQTNNVFSKKYVANGYSFSYIYGGTFTTENYFYPMAIMNWMGGISLKL